MSGCKFYNTIQYNTIQYNTIQYNTSHYYNYWRFFHCKIKELFETFKRFLWRSQKLNIQGDIL